MDVVYVELDRCIACSNCEHACRFHQTGLKKGGASNIFVSVDMERRRIYTGTCLQCETALCKQVCPVDALMRDTKTQAVTIDKEMCIGCGMCVVACPFGYMQLDDSIRRATKCDLCSGNPKCVQVCMARALHFGSINSVAARKRARVDLRLGVHAVPGDKDGDS